MPENMADGLDVREVLRSLAIQETLQLVNEPAKIELKPRAPIPPGVIAARQASAATQTRHSRDRRDAAAHRRLERGY